MANGKPASDKETKGKTDLYPLHSLSAWQIDYKAFIPGAVCLVAIVVAGAVAPEAFGSALTAVHGWLMGHFKWLYILVVALILTLALAIALVYYNGRRTLRASDALFPLIGEHANGIGGTVVNTLQVVCLLICGTNMGLAVIQLNAGIGTVAGMGETPSLYIPIIVFYMLLTCFLATSGVHKLMGKVGNVNAVCYFFILLFILVAGPAGLNRLLGLLFTSMGQFAVDFVPMTTFADPIYETGWQDHMTMYYYSWNLWHLRWSAPSST